MYKGMHNKILKNYQINIGTPFQVHSAISFNTAGEEPEPEREEQRDHEPEEIPVDIVSKAREEAELIIKEAELEAGRVLENAAKEAERALEAAAVEGWKKGYEEGLAQGKSEYEALIKEAELLREHSKAEYGEVLASMEADVAEIILEIAKKLVGDELVLNGECVLNAVREAFEKCENREGVVLRVSPDDHDYIASNRERLFSMVEDFGDFEIKKDCSLKRGACILDTSFGSIDAGLNTRLKKIEEAFRNAVTR